MASESTIRLWSDLCDGLRSDKITTRKKSAEEVRSCLTTQRSRMLPALGVVSSGISAGSPALQLWNSTLQYLRLESAKLEADGRKKGSLNSLSTPMGLVRGFVVEVLQRVIQHAPATLAPESAFRTLTEILVGDWGHFLRDHFAECAVKVLSYALPRPDFHRRCMYPMWPRLLEGVFHLFVSTPQCLTLLSTCQFLHTVIFFAHQQTGLVGSVLRDKLDVLTRVLTESRLRQESMDTINAFFQALNLVCRILSLDCRPALCQMGEIGVSPVLDMFESRTKTLIVEFLVLQMQLHHPKGADTVEKGALVHDEREWRTGLYRIYANIIDTSIRNHIRRLNSRFERNYYLEEPLVQLAAMVCHQLFMAAKSANVHPPIMHVTQITHLDTTQGAPGPKRRRIEGACLHDFLEFIRQCMGEKDAQKKSVAHLQVLKAMLEQFPDSFRDESPWQSIFQLVTESLKSCKLAEARTLLLDCGLFLLEMRETFHKIQALQLSQLWESALTCIATNQCTKVSHSVAQIMIRRNLGKNLNNLYELYLRRVIRCNPDSMKTLSILLHHRDVPPSADLEGGCSPSQGLFLWVFDEDADSEESVRYSDWELAYANHPDLVADLIWSILLKSKSNCPFESSETSEIKSSILDLETSLLTLAQREPIVLERNSTRSSSKADSKPTQITNSTLSSDMASVLTHIQNCFDRIYDLLPKTQGAIDPKNTNGSLMKAIQLTTLQAHLLIRGHLNLATQSSFLTRIGERLSEFMKLCLKSLLLVVKAKDVPVINLSELKQMASCLSVICDNPGPVSMSWPHDLAQNVIETILLNIREWSKLTSKTDEMDSSFRGENSEDFEEEDSEVRHARESFRVSQRQVVTHAYVVSIHLSWIMLEPAQFEELVQKILASLVQYSESNVLSSDKCHLVLTMVQKLAAKMTRRQTKMEDVIKLIQNSARFALKSSKNKDVSAFDPGVTIALLEALRSLIVPLALNVDTGATQRFHTIVKILINVQYKSCYKMYPPGVEVGLLELLLAMSRKQNPLFKGSDLNKTSNALDVVQFEADLDFPLSYCFFRLILHELCQIRLLSLQGIFCHFQRTGMDILKKQKDLQRLKGALDHFMNTHPQGKCTLSLYAPCVLAYGVVALAEEALDREVVVGLITLRILHKIPKFDTKLAVKNMGAFKIGPDVTTRKYLTPMLTFIFNEYLKLFQTFKKFPTFLLDCDSVSSMVRDFEELCVPVYLWRHPNEDQCDMVEDLGKPLETLCTNNFPRIAAFMLPSAAPSGETIGTDRKARTKSRLILDKVTSVLGQDKFNDLLNQFIPEILSMVFKSVHDSRALKEKFGCDFVLCQPNPPYTSEDLALNLIPFFDDVANSQGKLFRFLIELIPDTLQRMVHEISLDLKNETVYIHSKIRALHGLHLFLSTIEKENAELLEQFPFVLWFVADNIQLIMTKYASSKELLILSLAIAEKLIDLSAYFQDSHGQVLWLVPLRNCLCPLLDHVDPLLQQRTVNLFKNMLSTHSIRMELAKMGPFPTESPAGSDLNELLQPDEGASFSFSLSESIHHFLEFEEFDKSHRVQSLQNLQSQLRKHREEKNVLLNELADSLGFTEDARSSLIHRLLCALLKILETRNKEDSHVRVLVARCLGEIGPVNLHTYALEPRPEFQTNFLDLFASYLPVIVKATIPYVNSTDVHVSCAAVRALKALIRTPQESKLNMDNLGHYHKLLEPFRTSLSSQSTFVFQLNVKVFNIKMGNDDLWSMSASFSHWIKDLTTSILSCLTPASTYLALKDLCSLESDFAVVCFPILIHEILQRHFNDRPRDLLSEQFRMFFHKFTEQVPGSCGESSQSSTSSNGDFVPYRHKSSLMTLLNVINHLRNQKLHKDEEKCSWERHFWLKDLDYLEVAEAALECSAYFSAIFFCDVWAQNLRKTDNELHQQSAQYEKESLLNMICEKIPEKGIKSKQILFESYKNLGEKDALYGCNDIGTPRGQLQMMIQEQHYFKAIGIMDSDMSGAFPISEEFAELLLQSGLFSVLLTHLKHQSSMKHTLPNTSTKLENVQYECLWRLEQWGPVELDHKSSEEDPDHFRLHHYNALSSLSSELSPRFSTDLSLARQSMIGALRLKNRESSASVYQSLARLALITELEEFQSLALPNGNFSAMSADHLSSSFESKHFADKEPILLQRCLAIQKLRQPMDRNIEPLVQASMAYLDETITEGMFQLSQDRLRKLESMLPQDQENQLKNEVHLKKAKAFWQANEKKMAISMMEDLVSQLRRPDTKSKNQLQNSADGLLPECLLTLGKWYCSEKSHSPNSVDAAFSEALTFYERSKVNQEQRAQAFLTMAKFCDEQYQKRLEYTESKDFENKQNQRKRIAESVRDLVKIKSTQGNMDVAKSRRIFDKSAKNDELEEVSILKETNRFLESAVINYGHALAVSGQCQDTPVYRFISLWFNNADNEKVNKIVEGLLNHLPTYKFIPMVYQLAARLSSTKSKFQTLLFEMLVRCVRDHPYHAIPVLLALVNANKDSDNPTKLGPNDADKVKVSIDVLNKSKNKGDSRGADIAQIITKMNTLSLALIELAYRPNQSKLPMGCKIQKLPNLTQIPILTTTIPLREDRNYKNKFAGIQKQDTTYTSPGGITAPKKISCLGTDGRKYTQLLKGKDDLRQDAVMQQVFSYLNSLLKSNRSTRQKRLRMRQYKVVPLSQRSGILEWCENTIPIRDYLYRAHQKYYPKDMKIGVIRGEIDKLNQNRESDAIKRKRFLELSKAFHPVFRYFFYENFPDPSVHLERRLAYTRSMATASMIGYILGLGDRHLLNMLVDCTTAEVIHIDFGVAFEQGKLLPTPEKVPFRLTRDLVDGFGPCGVEGSFKRCCEETLGVLRENKEGIMTILEVLIHDPLYQWSLTPERVFRIYEGEEGVQKSGSSTGQSENATATKGNGERNQMAEMALLRVRQKLNGLEEGSYLSISGQVNGLIQQARDSQNLSLVFCGWGAVL